MAPSSTFKSSSTASSLQISDCDRFFCLPLPLLGPLWLYWGHPDNQGLSLYFKVSVPRSMRDLPLPGTKPVPPAVEARSQPLSHHRSPQLTATLISSANLIPPLPFYIPSSQLLQIGHRQVFWGVGEGIILPTKGKSIIVQLERTHRWQFSALALEATTWVQVHHLPAKWPWASHFTFLNLSLLIQVGGDVSPNNGILPSNEKEWTVNTHSKVDESQDYYRWTKPDGKSTYCMICITFKKMQMNVVTGSRSVATCG